MKPLSPETEKAFKKLNVFLSSLDSAAVAFSGGVDSGLLLYVSSLIPDLKLKAYTIRHIMLPEDEIESAHLFTEKFKIEHKVIDIDILSFDRVKFNPPDRCYFCKTIIMNRIKEEAARNGIKTILEGTHNGDLNDFRPGLKAINELGIISPFTVAGFDRKKISELSEYFSLPSSGKESYSCLATRIPAGTPLSPELLKKAGYAEKIIRSFGFRHVRARIHGNILRIEIAEEMIHEIVSNETRKKLIDVLANAGFTYITIDLQGYRTGSMNLIDKDPHERR